jgi:hypothetical protein
MYQTNYKGIPVFSNIPFDKKPPPNSIYEITIKLNTPINFLPFLSDAINNLHQNFANYMAAYGHKITDLSITSPDPYTIKIKFKASSPPLAIVIAVITGLTALTTYFASQITASIFSPESAKALEQLGNIILYSVLGLGGIIGGLIIYEIIKR